MNKLKQQLAALALVFSLLTPCTLPSIAAQTAVQTTTQSQTDEPAQTQQESSSESEEDTQQSTASDDSTQQAESDNENTAQETPAEDTQQPAEVLDSNGIPAFTADAEAAILVNAETGDVLYERNATERAYPASTTKIMTALLVLENMDPDDTITMTKEDVDLEPGSSNANLMEGETLTVEDLLYCLMLPSANEAANAFAREIGGSIEGFANKMNARAKELGCTNTHFVNANGLHDENHYTCAKDMALIAQEAMKHELFATVVNTAQHRLPATNKQESRIILTTNHLILSRYSDVYYAAANGIKTGHTTPAGYCLVSQAQENGYTYYAVVLGCQMKSGASYAGSFTETIRLFDWAFDNWRLRTADAKGSAITEQHVRLGKGTDTITLVTQKDAEVLVPKTLNVEDMTVTYQIEDEYTAPIAKGSVLGTVTYSYDGKDYATVNLVALTDVDRSAVLYILDLIDQFLHTVVFRIIAIIAIIFAVLFLIRQRSLQKKRKHRKKRRNKTHSSNNTKK